MKTVTTNTLGGNFSFISSVKNDIWNGKKTGSAYEWWYFDALSDDGREAVVVIFLDNFVFSPRYNRDCGEEANDLSGVGQYPAVAFTYYLDGKPACRSIAEFSQSEFRADTKLPHCAIGENSFEYKNAPYGSGYFVNIDLPLSGKRRLKANLEWLSVESNLLPDTGIPEVDTHCWNLVAPRSDVTGRISIFDRKGRQQTTTFRGTGYHDHNSDSRWMPDSIDDWFWGRVHFPFATAVYYRYKEKNNTQAVSKLFMIRDGAVEVNDAEFEFPGQLKRDKFGVQFPSSIKVHTKDEELSVDGTRVIDSSFFYLRFLSTMNYSNGRENAEAAGISEYLCPASLKNRWLRQLIGFRIGRNGKSAFLP
jgi:carotenoid 1,2-hydratase